MKIGRKLMISNISVTLFTMVILTMIITHVVSNYVEEDIKEDIIKDNQMLTEWLSYNKFLKYEKSELYVYLSYYEDKVKLPTINAIFNINSHPQLLDITSNEMKEKLTEDKMNHLFNQDLGDVYSIRMNGKSYMAYNDSVQVNIEGHDYTLLVVTLLSNELMDQLTMDILKVLIAAITIMGILFIVFIRYNERMITKPVKVLVHTTEKIGKKNFDEKADIHTGDEFETLAVAINNMADSLKKQDIEQKKFYENISHEIKTPLTVISGYAQGIKTNIFEDSNKALDTIIVECDRLKKQLENFIYLSKLDTVNESYHLEKASLNELISNALEKLDSVIIINEIDIIFEPKPDVVLNVDKEKISRALTNTLSNCIKYTKDTIFINTENTEEWVKVEISDNGNGFNKALLENPFSRTIIGEKEGSGIGLSIIKKVVDGHKGKIVLKNKEEGGAIYIMELPV